MTSRLKRKLADLGVDASSSKANESFCQIGTPLPPLEKSKDTGEFVPLWKQEVKDDKGRRRLHGAFTGGFSAGYFNTVGSKEGWAPSTFVSSRADRAKQKQARPEDFMDDEDLAELAASRTLVDTAESADLIGGTSAELASVDNDTDSMAAQLERALLPPASDSAGARLLRKMGWRPGSGVGPRVPLRVRRLQDAQFAPVGAAAPPDVDDEAGEAAKHTYAPRDTPLLLPTRKDNTHGLGYSPGMGLQESVGGKAGAGADGPKLAAGFGLGALNEADDDDVDIYDSGQQRGKTRMAYDSIDRDDDERIVMGGRRGAQESVRGATRLPPSSTGGTFKNGQPVLRGFVVAEQPVVEDQWFALPDVPKGWKPDPKRVWQKDKENMSSKPTPGVQAHRDWKTGVSADDRGAKLGETPLPAAQRSVFDYMSQKTRERLQTAAARVAAGGAPDITTPTAGTSFQPPPPSAAPAPATIQIPPTDRQLARSALSGFQPFANEPAKHVRYTIYLQSQATPESAPPLRPLPGQSIELFNHEAEDYARSAAVFKPLSAAMAGRFTSAAIIENGPKAAEGLYTPSFESSADDGGEGVNEEKEEVKEEDPKAHAAKMGMYGPMTREIKPWRPSRLLCKRFGVREPEPDPEDTPTPAAAAPGSVPGGPGAPAPAEPGAEADAGGAQLAIEMAGAWEGKPKGPRDLANVGLGEDEYQARDVLTYERPAMDVFKAIFASDDEESGDEDAGEPAVDTPALVPAAKSAGAPPSLHESQPGEPAPAHLSTQPSTSTEYAPAPPPAAQPGAAPATVDLASFKPMFIPRADRETKKEKSKADRNVGDRAKKAKGKALVSFAAEDEGEDTGLGAPVLAKDKVKKRKDREKEKKGREKKRRKEEGGEDEDDMWVEKPPPEAVRDLGRRVEEGMHLNNDPAPAEASDGREAGPVRARKRAVDFM